MSIWDFLEFLVYITGTFLSSTLGSMIIIFCIGCMGMIGVVQIIRYFCQIN